MIKRGDIVVCIKKANEWSMADSCKEANFPIYKEECIVEAVVFTNNEYFLVIIGYNYQYAADCFRKIQDNLVNNILSKINEKELVSFGGTFEKF